MGRVLGHRSGLSARRELLNLTLGAVKDALEKMPKDAVCAIGFGEPNSYRGYYDQVAFKPAPNVLVRDMQVYVEDALSREFEGYKGGTYHYGQLTPVWIARWGECAITDEDGVSADALTLARFQQMLGSAFVR